MFWGVDSCIQDGGDDRLGWRPTLNCQTGPDDRERATDAGLVRTRILPVPPVPPVAAGSNVTTYNRSAVGIVPTDRDAP